MSKLVDLLNPAPANAAGNTSRPTVSTSGQVHRRNESLSSPLETLSIAATTNAATNQPRAAYTASFPPNPYLNTNPYAIKPQPAQANSQPSSRTPNAVQTPIPSSTNAENTKTGKPSPSPTSAAGMEHVSPSPSTQISNASIPAVVKKESPDEQLALHSKPANTPIVKIEGAEQFTAGHETGAETKEVVMAEVKPVKEHKKSTAATKKGTAKAKKDTGDSTSVAKKSAARKRKLDPESKDGTPFSQRSGTPNSRASKTPAQKRTPQQSPGPQASDNADDDDYDAASGEEDGEVYCICRRGDDHTWMIGCDGGCEDWFHGHCVQIDKADGPLIDKYICPNCEAAGQGRTMWKPMCRLPGCREPARVAGKKPSKYCSDEHGVQFMRDKALGRSGKTSKSDDARKRRKPNKTDATGNEGDEAALLNGEESDDGHQAHLRGGVLKPGELKALVSGVKTVEEFKRLGERIVSTAHDNTVRKDSAGDVAMEDADASNADLDAETTAPRLVFTKQEQVALDVSSKQRSKLNSQLSMLTDRDKLLTMVKARHKSVLEELRKKDKAVKDICGYDTRLMWSDEEFNQWRTSEEGKAILASSVLPPPAKRNAEAMNGTAEDDEEIGRGVCKRKRCERHKTWAKLEQQEINLARSQCWHQMRKLDRDEEELKDRALMRQREAR